MLGKVTKNVTSENPKSKDASKKFYVHLRENNRETYLAVIYEMVTHSQTIKTAMIYILKQLTFCCCASGLPHLFQPNQRR